MSITTTSLNTTQMNTSLTKRTLLNDMHHNQNLTSFNAEHFVNERYPKTCFEYIPSIILQYPPSKHGVKSTRSRQSLHFRTQPVTLAEIYEADEENKNDDNVQESNSTIIIEDFRNIQHLNPSEHIRQNSRKKLPLKNYLERQRLKMTREDPSEIDEN